jgi:CcmD family protein
MGTMTYIFAAYTVIWLAMLLYSYSVGARQKSLEREIETLKAVMAEKEMGAQA